MQVEGKIALVTGAASGIGRTSALLLAATTAVTGRAAYVAPKGAIHALTRAMALDHAGDGVRVNEIAPGTIDTPFFARRRAISSDPKAFQAALDNRAPMRRTGQPAEIAQMVLFPASAASSFATGATFTVDGGSSAW